MWVKRAPTLVVLLLVVLTVALMTAMVLMKFVVVTVAIANRIVVMKMVVVEERKMSARYSLAGQASRVGEAWACGLTCSFYFFIYNLFWM